MKTNTPTVNAAPGLTVDLANAELMSALAAYDSIMVRLVAGESVTPAEMASAVDSIKLAELRIEAAHELEGRRAAAAADERARETDDALRSPEWAGRLRSILDAYDEARSALVRLHELADSYHRDMASACLEWRRARPLGTDRHGRIQYPEIVNVDGIEYGAPEADDAARLVIDAATKALVVRGARSPGPTHLGAPAPVDVYRLALASLAGDDVDNE